MKAEILNNSVIVSGVECLDLDLTLDCGQAFRWERNDDGSYSGVAGGYFLNIKKENGKLIFNDTTMEVFNSFWVHYFDLNKDYKRICETLKEDELLSSTIDEYYGIRILNQEPWEALCSFILSQCCHIPRIRGVIERFCALYGEPLAFEGGVLYAFPAAEKTASLSEDDLAPLRCGYRAPYVLSAARAVSEGKIDLAELARGDLPDALAALKTIDGVGDKVAACAALFGLGFLDAFPRDVWINRVLAEQYGGDFDLSRFGGYAGIAQQYMFRHRRNAGE